MFQTSLNTTLLLLCDKNELCFECNETDYEELQILQPVYDLSLLFGNTQCSEGVSQLFCNAAIDSIENDSYILTEQCLEVRDDKCAAEWRIVENIFGVPLPSCNSFNGSANFSSEKAPSLNCPDDFGTFCGSLCQPLCADISLYSNAASTAYTVLNIILHIVSTLAGVITIITCCIQRATMYANNYKFIT